MLADIALPGVHSHVVVDDVLDHLHEHWLGGLAVRTPQSVELKTKGKHSRYRALDLQTAACTSEGQCPAPHPPSVLSVKALGSGVRE